MKKLLTIIAMMILFSSCETEQDEYNDFHKIINNHKYLLINGNYTSTWVHDPDCPCYNRESSFYDANGNIIPDYVVHLFVEKQFVNLTKEQDSLVFLYFN